MQKEKPIHEVRLGSIKAAIWKNETPGGGVRYSTHFSRIYRDEKEKEWKRTESFGRDDLLVVAKVADQAHTWIHGQTRDERDRDRERDRDDDRERARGDDEGRRAPSSR